MDDLGPSPALLNVQLAMPPSVNSIWRTTVRNGKPQTYRAKSYTEWMNTAAWTVKSAIAKTGQIKGDVSLFVNLSPRRGDLDNRLKAICDALVHGGALEDDDQIVSIMALWCGDKRRPGAHVRLRRR